MVLDIGTSSATPSLGKVCKVKNARRLRRDQDSGRFLLIRFNELGAGDIRPKWRQIVAPKLEAELVPSHNQLWEQGVSDNADKACQP